MWSFGLDYSWIQGRKAELGVPGAERRGEGTPPRRAAEKVFTMRHEGGPSP